MAVVPPVSPASLNVVALISGGKDSMFSLLHCLANNHKPVALANLYPAQKRSDPPSASQGISTTGMWDRDVDSFMYQTAGYNLIPLYSDTLGLPLYRQEIFGEARDSSLSYSGHDEDETEALIPLLKKVKEAHPEVNAVSSGAILSTYQRTRVESVAVRLGLVPLAFLWQYPSLPPPSPDGLLEDMANAGFDVRIVKVASGGLAETLLWSNLTDPSTRRKLERAVSRFGGSVLGEGGEYETIVVCGPSGQLAVQNQFDYRSSNVMDTVGTVQSIDQFWNGRIEVADTDMRTAMETSSNSSAFLSFKQGSGKFLSKSLEVASTRCSNPPRPVLKIPNIWDEQFSKLLQQVGHACEEDTFLSKDCACGSVKPAEYSAQVHASEAHLSVGDKLRSDGGKWSLDILGQSGAESHSAESHVKTTSNGEVHTALSGAQLKIQTTLGLVDNFYMVANLTGPSMGVTAQSQMEGIAQNLLSILKDIKRPTSSIVFTTIILSKITDFATINLIYGKLFEKPNPPARVTVACTLPVGIKLMMSVIINMSDKVNALHVQSRSYWAPANIGPYSQAISIPLSSTIQPYLVFVAGQIPLVPGAMNLLMPPERENIELTRESLAMQDGFLARCCLSMQHLWRIGREMEVTWWTGAIAFTTGGGAGLRKANIAWTIWQKVHARELWKKPEEEEGDDSQIDVWHSKYGGMGSLLLRENEKHRLPDFNTATHLPQDSRPILSDGDAELPQSEDVVPGFFAVEVDDLPRGSDIEWQSLGIAQSEVSITTISISDGEQHLQIKSCIIGSTRTCVAFVNVPFHSSSETTLASRGLSRAVDWVRNVSALGSDLLITIYTPKIPLTMDIEAHFVPCRAVWGSGGSRLSAGLVAQFKIKRGMEGQ